MSLRFAANLSFLYQDLPFLDRIDAAARDGFKAVEYVSPLDFPAEEIRRRLDDHGMRQVLFNTAVGDWAARERGIGALPGRQADFRDAVGRALDYTDVLGNRLLHVMAGLVPAGADRAAYAAAFQENLAWAAQQAAAQGVTLLLEPINQRDMPGYFLSYQRDALDLIDAIGAPNLGLQFDCYHCQVMEGDVVTRLRATQDRIGHIQIASAPGRHEPDGEELNYPFVFETLRQIGYDGWIGCEYKPRAGTSEGLGWLRDALRT
ncbi:2-oxo-tetronate isomerase [Bordetella genomosp. 13]|uniref:2-oxo-tetronate isomerase n=1 Tax=Bordetella genomosp. 13 TaxID=463040 RepID=UPI00119CA9C6|nr:2-oxo-tetronate isomerase [Bordetella genomosp. 13]